MSWTAQMERLQELMQRLRLVKTAVELPVLLQEASKKETSCVDFLEDLLTREATAKSERHTTVRTTMARFPFQKSLESFDFKQQPSLDAKVIRELATGRFIADAENILLLGPPGVGKTHLAVGLGLKACASGYRTAFTTAAALIAALTKAQNEGRLEEKLRLLVQPKLLIVDEIGYLPIDRAGANLFFVSFRQACVKSSDGLITLTAERKRTDERRDKEESRGDTRAAGDVAAGTRRKGALDPG